MAVKVIRICDTCSTERQQDLDGIPVLEVRPEFTCPDCIASGVKPKLYVAKESEAQATINLASERYRQFGQSATLVVHTPEQRHFAEAAQKAHRMRGQNLGIMYLTNAEHRQLMPAGTFIYIRE